MNSIEKLFQANPDPLVGKDSAFVIDKNTSSGPAFYLRDKNRNIVGFTHEGKHVFLQNVQKNKSGALFSIAQYKLLPQEVDQIINGYFIYLNNSGKNVTGSENNGKHVFAQVKDRKNTLINKFKKKKPEIPLGGKILKFKELNPFVDFRASKSKTKSKEMHQDTSTDSRFDLEGARANTDDIHTNVSVDNLADNLAVKDLSLDELFELEEDRALEESRAKEEAKKSGINKKDNMRAYASVGNLIDLGESKALKKTKAKEEAKKSRIKNKKDKMHAYASVDDLLGMGEPNNLKETRAEETKKSRIKNKKDKMQAQAPVGDLIDFGEPAESMTEERKPRFRKRNETQSSAGLGAISTDQLDLDESEA